MLVSVLPALAGAAEPFNPNVLFIKGGLTVSGLDNSHGHGRSVDAPTTFSWRHSLEAVTSCLGFPFSKRAGDFEREEPVTPFGLSGFSTVDDRPALIASGQHINEKPGIFATLGGTNFNQGHDFHRLIGRPSYPKGAAP